MSFRRLLDRTISLIPTIVTGQDAHGNDVIADGTELAGVPAARDLLESLSGEDTDGADRQMIGFVYLIPARLDDGTVVELDGYSKLVDGTDTFELVGPPELLTRRRGGRPHHWEATVRKIEG